MSRTYDCTDPSQRTRGIAAAARMVKRGKLVVLPTDTVYGIGCDAFNEAAVNALLVAKGRGPDMPVPVLVGSPATLAGISAQSGGVVKRLTEAFWPGALTIVCTQQPTLKWNLGNTQGTVAVRMPLHPVAIEVLRETGPMAVSSANRSGQPPARSGEHARQQLGSAVAVYLDSFPSEDDVPSTIVDVTGEVPRVLREGAIPTETLREVVPETAGAAVPNG
ncbi:MAG TPA: L-threonylcarbamoyladenylate synthase [Jiangellaceae bacterium]|nr:L-threonylcarbamoyladenylate synthase [Jiangellaceae bacterium]